jgi:glucokinase
VDAVIARMVEQAQMVWPTDDRVTAVGVSAPGPIDPFAGVITAPPNLKGWHDVPLQRRLEEKLGTKVYLGNDANVAVLAEAELGAARGYTHVVFLTISTGVGGGVLIDNRMLLGAQGFAAELGHIMLVVDGDRVSTLEKEASGTGLARQAAAALEKGTHSIILDMAEGNLNAVTGKMVGKAAAAGDKLARQIVERAGWIIGLGITTFLHSFNPQIIVIGGGVAIGTWDMLLPPMWDAIKKNAMDSSYWEQLKIVQPALGENVSLYGAAALAMRKGT